MQSIDFNTLADGHRGSSRGNGSGVFPNPPRIVLANLFPKLGRVARANLEADLVRDFAGGEMKRTLFLAAVLGSLVGLISGASAQEKNELTGLIGRTFVSDQGVTGTSTPGALSPPGPA